MVLGGFRSFHVLVTTTFEKDKKTSHQETDAYCLKALARAMIITKFKQEPILN